MVTGNQKHQSLQDFIVLSCVEFQKWHDCDYTFLTDGQRSWYFETEINITLL